jgi:protein SCO1/2
MNAARLAPVLALGLVALAGPAGARTEPFDPFGAAGVDQRPGAIVPLDAPFTTSSGQSVTLRALTQGRPLVLTPVQHACPNICGLTLGGLSAAIKGQAYRPGRDFTVVAFGIDPSETAKQARVSAAQLGPGSYAVTGKAHDNRAVTDALGYHYAWDERIGQYAHIAATVVLTPDGRVSRWLFGVSPRATDLHLALTEAGRGRIGGLVEQIRLLCYHYDPLTGRYSGSIMLALRLGAVAVLVLLAGGVGLGFARRRTA